MTKSEIKDIINVKEVSNMLLIISKNKKIANSVSETFYYMSILSFVASPHEALSEISTIYRAVLVIDPSSFPDITDYVNRIKSYRSDIPIFALVTEPTQMRYADVFDECFTNTLFTPRLAERIIEYANKNHRSCIGDYYLAGFDASSKTIGVYYFYTKLNLTKTEAMILRYLIRSYPCPTNAKNILKHAFKPSRSPEQSSIRTHLSLMNKKLEKSIGRKMIGFEPSKGYIILTPDYLENKSKAYK